MYVLNQHGQVKPLRRPTASRRSLPPTIGRYAPPRDTAGQIIHPSRRQADR